MVYKVGQYLVFKLKPTSIVRVVVINSRGGIRTQSIDGLTRSMTLNADWVYEHYDIIGNQEDLRMYLMNRSLNE